MKTTKKQAQEIYDNYMGVMRNLNGGTKAENEKMAARCFEMLREWAEAARAAAQNPSKKLMEDSLLDMIRALPGKREAFGVRYNLTEK